MRKFFLAGCVFLISLMGKAQFTQSDLIYYVGEGPDTAVIVVNFLDDTEDSCYAWGFLFDEDATITGEDALEAIAADEEMFDFGLDAGFLDIISYNDHFGDGGDPNFWGIWSKTAETDWESNDGLAEELSNGEWYGMSYTDFDPAILPGEPLPAYESARYSASDVQFWVGTGSDSAMLVVDFITSPAGQVVSYAWGYIFDGPTDAATMLADISEADINLEIDAGDFLNDILYNGLEGLAGDPNWWGTFSGTNLTDWTTNTGIDVIINDGDWYGCSYDAAWPPKRPFNPISALDSADVPLDDVEFATGSGDNKVVLVIDFNEWLPEQSYTFGYLFDTETITAAEVMEGLQDDGFFGLEFNLDGGFLNDIIYGATGEEGLSGMPNYWSTWSARNVGGWEINEGIDVELSNGDWFGCSYSSWSPATPPSLPQVGLPLWGIDEESQVELSIYPNPAKDQVNVVVEEAREIQIVDLQGRMVLSIGVNSGNNTIDISDLDSGVYFVVTSVNGQHSKERLIINK